MPAPPAPSAFSLVASPRRREILRLVWNRERSAGEIHRAMPDVTFGAVSLQLKALADAGLITCRRDRRQRFYRARREALGAVGRLLEQMWDDALWKLKLAAELDETRRGPKPRRPHSKAAASQQPRTAGRRRAGSKEDV